MAAPPPAELRRLLQGHGIRARKGLGQHFLVDPDAVAAVIEAADVKPTDTVVEIGPGPGVLTPALCRRAVKVVGIELDQAVLGALRAATVQYRNFELRPGDVLKIDPASLPQPYQVVANLPYYITSAILRHFLESSPLPSAQPSRPQTMTLTLQAEVAERIVATSPKMSILAVSVQLYGRPRIAMRIPRTAFWPAPEVDSAVLRIERIGRDLAQTLDGLSEAEFFTVVRAGFAEKRKQVHNSLARHLDLSHEEALGLLEQAAVEPARRAETLEIAEWVHIGKAYAGR